MDIPVIPEWWPEKTDQDPTPSRSGKFITYVDYRKSRNEFDVTVYFKMDGRNFRLDFSGAADNLDGFWERGLVSILSDILELTDRPDGWGNEHQHLVFADRVESFRRQ